MLEYIQTEDFNNLKTNINTEFTRRDIPTSVNDSNLKQFAVSYSKNPAQKDYVYTSYANESIDELINYLKGKNLVEKTKKYDYIPDLNPSIIIVNNLQSVTDYQTSSHGCNAICIGLCYGACYGNCNGCTSCTGASG